MSYKWPGIPNGDYSFDHGRAVWNKIINYLRRLSEKLDADIVDATADRRGMMTAADKDKLDGVEPGAEVNQNAFSGVKVGNSTIEADSKTDVVELVAGTGIELTVDTTNDKVTIGGKEATTTAAGLMSATDKSKLDGIQSGAEVNQNAFSNIQVGPAIVAADSKTDTLTLGPGAGVIISANTTNDSITIGCVEATQSVPGIMSTADKTKLDGITAGAEPNQNAFSNVKVGSTTVAADAKTDTLELVAGSNITLTPDATNDKVTIAATDTTYSNFTGATAESAGAQGLVPTPPAGAHTSCLMGNGGWAIPTYLNTTEATLNSARPVWFSYVSNTQRACYNTGFTYNPGTGNLVVDKINGFTIEKSVPSDAKFTDTVYTHPTSSGNKHIPSGGSSDQLLFWSADGTAAWGNSKWIGNTGIPQTALSGLDNRSPDDTFGIWDGNGGGTGRAFLYASSGHQTGAVLDLIGANYTGSNWVAGSFNIVASNGTNTPALRGLPNGSLTWDNNKIITAADTVTTSTAGIMSASDKTKLNGIASGAEVNQNAFSYVKIGNSTIAADTTTDTLTIAAGDYISLTADTTNDKVAIGLSMPVVNGTLTATSNVPDNYSSVFRCGRVGYLMIGCSVVAAAKTAWTNTTLYTSSIKPAKNIYQVVHNQDNTSSGCVEITTNGDVILHTYGKALTDGFIRCSVVFAV